MRGDGVFDACFQLTPVQDRPFRYPVEENMNYKCPTPVSHSIYSRSPPPLNQSIPCRARHDVSVLSFAVSSGCALHLHERQQRHSTEEADHENDGLGYDWLVYCGYSVAAYSIVKLTLFSLQRN